MGFTYNPKDASQAMPKGQYEASILRTTCFKDNGEPMRSRSGEQMQMVTFEVYTTDGKTRQLRAYFTEKSTLFRYRKLAHALGKAQDFTDKRFDAENHVGANLILDLDVKDDPTYGEQNEIVDFLPSKATTKRTAPAPASALPTASAAGLAATDIPF